VVHPYLKVAVLPYPMDVVPRFPKVAVRPCRMDGNHPCSKVVVRQSRMDAVPLFLTVAVLPYRRDGAHLCAMGCSSNRRVVVRLCLRGAAQRGGVQRMASKVLVPTMHRLARQPHAFLTHHLSLQKYYSWDSIHLPYNQPRFFYRGWLTEHARFTRSVQ
jgi:hypothetical protein